MKSNEVKQLEERMVRDLFREEHLILAVQSSVGMMRYLGRGSSRLRELSKAGSSYGRNLKDS